MENYKTPLIFAGTFAMSYVIVKAVRSASQKPSQHLPPALHNLPLIGSLLAMPVVAEWHVFFLEKSAELGSVIGMHLGQKYNL
jgi:hypothetical protein